MIEELRRFSKLFTSIQGGPKLCVKNLKAGRGDLNNQISYKNVWVSFEFFFKPSHL